MDVRAAVSHVALGIYLGFILRVDPKTVKSLAVALAQSFWRQNPWTALRAPTGPHPSSMAHYHA